MLRVLTYHRVADPQSTPWLHPRLISATPSVFLHQMRILAAEFDVIGLEDVFAACRDGEPLPDRAVLITFDDAYRDFGTTAWPILKSLGLPAVLFVPTAYPGHPERVFWWDRLYRAFLYSSKAEVTSSAGHFSLRSRDHRFKGLGKVMQHVKALPHGDALAVVDELCRHLGEPADVPPAVLGWDELRQLAREGVVLGPHTRTHPLLTQVSTAEARDEVVASRRDLESEIGPIFPVFCFPGGAHDPALLRVIGQEGIELAFTTVHGPNPLTAEAGPPIAVRRTNVTPRTSPLVFRLRLTTLGTRLDAWRHDPRRKVA